MIIIGAGLAGCLAGVLCPASAIFEAGSEQVIGSHKAVLRFREDKIGRAVGIPFKPVTVHKSIWRDRRHHNWCSPRDANQYSMKVIHGYRDRSIHSLETVTRYVAPDDFHAQLLDRVIEKVHFSTPVRELNEQRVNDCFRHGAPIISTMPLNKMAALLGIQAQGDFTFDAIHVERFLVRDCDVHQTIYFPDPELSAYRATLTGASLIIESVSKLMEFDQDDVLEAFGLRELDVTWIGGSVQGYGKIKTIDAARRKKMLFDITMKARVYSLGRFACWRNILLDDVYEDLFKIRSMINMNDYDLVRSIT